MTSPSPTDRLEALKRLAECRVCAWLDTLSEKDRVEWQKAIVNPRFGAALVANTIEDERAAARDDRRDNEGARGPAPVVGESSVTTHRSRGHR